MVCGSAHPMHSHACPRRAPWVLATARIPTGSLRHGASSAVLTAAKLARMHAHQGEMGVWLPLVMHGTLPRVRTRVYSNNPRGLFATTHWVFSGFFLGCWWVYLGLFLWEACKGDRQYVALAPSLPTRGARSPRVPVRVLTRVGARAARACLQSRVCTRSPSCPTCVACTPSGPVGNRIPNRAPASLALVDTPFDSIFQGLSSAPGLVAIRQVSSRLCRVKGSTFYPPQGLTDVRSDVSSHMPGSLSSRRVCRYAYHVVTRRHASAASV